MLYSRRSNLGSSKDRKETKFDPIREKCLERYVICQKYVTAPEFLLSYTIKLIRNSFRIYLLSLSISLSLSICLFLSGRTSAVSNDG
jgi:hypothetical protein